jgi:hypothetical protein
MRRRDDVITQKSDQVSVRLVVQAICHDLLCDQQ